MAIIVEGQGSRIAEATGGIYVAFADPAHLSQIIGEVVVGALVRQQDSFFEADIVPSPEIAPYVLVQPSRVAVPSGGSPFTGDITFRVSLRAPFNRLVSSARQCRSSSSCNRSRQRTRTIQGALRAVVDGGIIGQIFVEIVLPIDANSRCASSDDRSCC